MRSVNYQSCNNLQEVAEQTIKGLSEVYWADYPEYIKRLPALLEDCSSYRELGTNQGGSASVVVLENLKYYELIDVNFNKYNQIKHHFDNYILDKNIEIEYHEMSSLAVETDVETDFILIDSVHKYNHVMSEIKLYEPLTKKYIMFHDTVSYPKVGKAVNDFLNTTNNWEVIEEQTVTPGYVVLKRIS